LNHLLAHRIRHSNITFQKFWQNVFEESNYKAAEKEAIAKAFSEFV